MQKDLSVIILIYQVLLLFLPIFVKQNTSSFALPVLTLKLIKGRLKFIAGK